MRDERPLDVMIVQATLDPDLPLDLAERLRIAMTVHSLPHGARALELIEAGASPDIILVDRRAPGVDVAAMRRMLQMRGATAATAISFIDGKRALVRDAETLEAIALVHGVQPRIRAQHAGRLHDDDASPGDDDQG